MERVLHAIAVMGVDIEVDNVVEAGVEPGEDAEHRVVEVAEAAGACRAAVMGAAAGAVDGSAGQDGAAGEHDAAGRGHGATVDLGVDGVALGADAEAGAVFVGDGLGGFGAKEGVDVGGVVEALDMGAVGHGSGEELVVGEPAHGAHEVGAGGDAGDGEGVAGAVGGVAIDFAADVEGL